MVRLAFAVLASLVLLPLAHAAERSPGTCLTVEGVWLAPWSDAFDPACGADCGDDDLDGAAEASCDDDQCLMEGAALAPRLPAPSGPRCLEPGPTCGESEGGGLPLQYFFAGGAGAAAVQARCPRPGSGTLPGAGLPEYQARFDHHIPNQESPPPRA